MVPDVYIYRAANMLLHQRGPEAAAIARQRAAEFRARGDADGEALWLRILAAVRTITDGAVRASRTPH